MRKSRKHMSGNIFCFVKEKSQKYHLIGVNEVLS